MNRATFLLAFCLGTGNNCSVTLDYWDINSATELNGYSTVQRHNSGFGSGIYDLPKTPGIYSITLVFTGDEYIGSAVSVWHRVRDHVCMLSNGTHHCRHLQRAWSKYGRERFRVFVVENVARKELLIPREQFYIDSRNPKYNSCRVAGSTLGTKMSDAAREKLRIIKTGKSPSEGTAKKISESLKRTLSNKSIRAAISERNRKRWLNPEYKARVSEAISKSISAEERKRRSEWVRGYLSDPEAREIISRANRGKIMSKETRSKIAAATRVQWAKRRAKPGQIELSL